MPVTRGRAKAVHSASATPSSTVSPMFSAGTSPPSTPDTSVADDEDTVLKQPSVKPTKTAATSKKRVHEDVSGEEDETPSTKKGAKRRIVQQAAYVEIATKKITKVVVTALSRSRKHNSDVLCRALHMRLCRRRHRPDVRAELLPQPQSSSTTRTRLRSPTTAVLSSTPLRMGLQISLMTSTGLMRRRCLRLSSNSP